MTRNIWTLWTGQTVSLLGSELTKLALPLLALHRLHATAAQVGMLRAGGTAPTLVTVLFVGVWADRFRKKPLLMSANLAQAVLLAALAALTLTGSLSFGVLLTAVLLLGVAATIFQVAYPSFVPAVVPVDRLSGANARLFSSQSVAEAAGPGLAGLSISWGGPALVMLLDAGSFVFSAGAIRAVRVTETAAPASRDRAVLRDLSVGLRAMAGHPILRSTVLAAGIYNFWEGAMLTVFLVYAVRDLALDNGLLGVALGGGGVGAIAGAAVSGWTVQKMRLGRVLVAAYTIGCLAPLLLLLSDRAEVAVPFAAFLVAAFGTALYSVQAITVRQAATPPFMRGRIAAVSWLFVLGSMPLGVLFGGLLGSGAGLYPALVLSVAGLPLGVLPLLMSPVPRLASLPAGNGPYWERFR